MELSLNDLTLDSNNYSINEKSSNQYKFEFLDDSSSLSIQKDDHDLK